MSDPAMVAATVALLVPYLSKGAEGMAEEFGRGAASGVEKLYALVRAKLTKSAAVEALDDLANDAEEADNRPACASSSPRLSAPTRSCALGSNGS